MRPGKQRKRCIRGMADTSSRSKRSKRSGKVNALCRVVVLFSGVVVFIATPMFLGAGHMKWERGWCCLIASISLAILCIGYLWHTNPEVVVARSGFHYGTKHWDKAICALMAVGFLTILATAGVDNGRLHWSRVPTWATTAGYVLLIAGVAVDTWGKSVNKFAEWTVRMQTERNQKVVTNGPYAIVRHPLNVAGFFVLAGVPLALGSFWALIPASTTALVLVVRTTWEDQVLCSELEGYQDYVHRVRYRLVPGIW